MPIPSAGPPVAPGSSPVGRRSVVVHDPARDGRTLDVELWYPALDGADEVPLTTYEVLPGVAFQSSVARHGAPIRPGSHPLLLLSHGRTGNRINYSGLCEALASRGAIVVAPDHPGDVLMDWLSGRHSDDRTNEVDRLADAHLLIAAMTDAAPEGVEPAMPADVRGCVDADRIVVLGHSYGAFTAFAASAGSRGVARHERVRAAVVLQPYTRSASDTFLARVTVPTLLVASTGDRTTPPSSDADRPWRLMTGSPAWRLDLDLAGHHAASDVPLYAELVHQISGVPDIVRQYLEATAAEAVLPGGAPWRTTLERIVRTVWAFLDVALDLDPASGIAAAEAVASEPGCTLLRR